MQKSIFIIAILSVFISFTSCNETKKTDTTEATTNTEVAEQTATTSKQKIEKFDAFQFNEKMLQLIVYNLVDVRTPEEFAQASIPKSKNIDINGDSFEAELAKLEKEKPLFIYCKSGGRSAKAVEKATEMGFERIIELDGGMDAWKKVKAETAHGI